ncbi:hypothetical protein Tco_0397701 [Tanacetum coccineum]
MFMHTARDDSLLGAEPPISRKSQKKSDSTISSEESPSKKKYAKAKKVVAPKPKQTKKKTVVKTDRGKGLNVLLEVALSEAAQLKVTKRNKKDFHISHASGPGDETNYESGDPNEQHLKTTGADEGTGDSGEEDEDDENDSEEKSDDGDDDDDGNDGNDGNDDDDNQEGDDTNNDDEETDSDRTESDIIKIPVLNQSSTEYYEEEEEKIDDEETMDEGEDDEVTKELYDDVNVNFVNRDADMTDAAQGFSEQQNVSQESRFEKVKEDYHVTLTLNPSLADNKIASLMGTSSRHTTEVPEITSSFTTTIPPPPPFFNPLPQQATPTLTPTTSEATTSIPSLLDFSSIFKFNDRVTNLEKDLSEINQVDQYTQSLSSIPAIVDC